MKKIWLFIIIILAILWWIWAYWYFCIYNPKTLIEYYPNGQIRYEYHEAYGSLHWPQIDYYKDGQIYRQNYYFHGQPHWQSITFYENGQESNINYYYYWKQVWDSFSYRPTWEIRSQWRYIDWKPVDWECMVYFEDWSVQWKIRYKSWDILCSSEWYDWSWEKFEEPRFRWICIKDQNVKFPDSNVIYWWKWEHKITGDKTIYYSSWYWISLRIRADFSWGIILESDSEQHDIPTENRYNTHDIHFLKIEDPELWTYQGWFLITVLSNDQAEKRETASTWNDGRENSIIWKNNKYTFIGLPSNSDSYTDLYIFDVKELWEGILVEKSIEKNVNINIEGEITESEEWFLPIIDSEANIYHLPTCNPVKVDETKPIIPIDDVVENCSYEEWFAWSWDSWGVWGVMPMVYIMKNVIWIPIRWIDAWDWEWRHPEWICYTDDIWLVAKPTRENQNIFIEFLEKHKFRKSRLLLFASETTTAEMFKNTIFFCENEELCNQLWQPAWWENDKHYYVRWIRKDWEQEVLVVDGILYGLWKYKSIFENYYPSPLKESERNVYWLSWDKLIVKKYIDWELIPPYTMNNFKSYKFDKPTTTTKFKIKTCDISL